jgi:raffinose synthase
VALRPRGFELITFAPIDAGFAAIGLADKFNSAGAVGGIRRGRAGAVEVALRDGGEFVAWCERRPGAVGVDSREADFDYDAGSGALHVAVRGSGEHAVEIAW